MHPKDWKAPEVSEFLLGCMVVFLGVVAGAYLPWEPWINVTAGYPIVIVGSFVLASIANAIARLGGDASE